MSIIRIIGINLNEFRIFIRNNKKKTGEIFYAQYIFFRGEKFPWSNSTRDEPLFMLQPNEIFELISMYIKGSLVFQIEINECKFMDNYLFH